MDNRLSTSYLGLSLRSPVIVGSCPLTMQPEATRQLVEAGIGAIALPSILQEQIINGSLNQVDPIAAAQQLAQAPQQNRYNGGPSEYLKRIQQLKEGYSLPVIASMHGSVIGPWLDYAHQIQSCGADALELNWQMGRADPSENGADIENRMVDWVMHIRKIVDIPIAVRMGHQFANLSAMAQRLQSAGADGLILFTHRPTWDIDIESMQWTIGWELTPVASLGKTLEGIVEARSGGLKISIGASGGIRSGEDAIKALIAGANAVLVVSEIYRQGPVAVRDVLSGIERYLDGHQYASLAAFQAARPDKGSHPKHSMRWEIVDPLTSSTHYHDPTPEQRQITGDAYGHPSQ